MTSNKIYKLSQIINPIIAGAAEKNSLQFLQVLLKNTTFDNITYVSGGYVRDFVKGIESNDLDLVVQAKQGAKQLSDFILNLFDGYVAYQKLNPLYPTYNLLFKDNITMNGKKYCLKGADIDISDTAKARYAEDSGKKQLFIYGDLKDDACQRDFTMNSLYLQLNNNKILDPTGLGITDIKKNLIRLIPQGNCQMKLFNNPKVLLRYCRFYAKYHMNVVKKDIYLMNKYAYRITTLQDQQIQKEIDKIPNNCLQQAISMMKLIGIYNTIQRFLI